MILEDSRAEESARVTAEDNSNRRACVKTVVQVETVSRLRHVIHITDAATPTKKAKPPGVNGAETWAKVSPASDLPPTDPKALTFVALDTGTPYTLDFAGEDGGKNAHYMLRWVNRKGEQGPWSETATVGA